MVEHNFHPVRRPDIDGLRALAILPVVTYHAFPNYAPGGFIGVDIFFVISGYLISLIIFKSLMSKGFVFTEFYAHRIKRIFPALIVVTASSYVLGWFALLPDEFKQLGKHIAAGMGFVQNFVLWKEAGYFDVASELKPLMHLWSLAIEEQFYLIYPLLVWLAWKTRLNLLVGIILTLIISFALSYKGSYQDAVKTFFVPHTRFWELMAGSLIAYIYGLKVWGHFFSQRERAGIFNQLFFRAISLAEKREVFMANAMSFIGLALVVYSVAAFDRTVPYPGLRALAPVLGAVFLILAGPHAWVNRRLLANKILVWVGLISYPLYLWHWPLLSFARIVESEVPTCEVRVAVVVSSFLLAALTYWLVEKPIRYGRPTSIKVSILCAIAVIVGCVGYYAYSGSDKNYRFPFVSKEVFDFGKAIRSPFFPGKFNQLDDQSAYPSAYIRKGSGNGVSLFIGDSNMMMYSPRFSHLIDTSSNANTAIFIAIAGCAPLPGLEYPGKGEECRTLPKQAIEILKDFPQIKNIVFVSNWPAYFTSESYVYDKHAGKRKSASPVGDGFQGSFDAFSELVGELKQGWRQVTIVSSIPTGIALDPVRLIKRSINDFPNVLSVNLESSIDRIAFEASNKPVLKQLERVSIKNGAKFINPFEELCSAEKCFAAHNAYPIYTDSTHLNPAFVETEVKFLDFALFD